MKDLFHIVDEAQVVLKSGGFIRLGSHDATSCPKVSWESLDYPAETPITFDKLQGPVWAGKE